jgi:hypothetical protein
MLLNRKGWWSIEEIVVRNRKNVKISTNRLELKNYKDWDNPQSLQFEKIQPAFSNVLCLGVMCGVEKVSQLINRPVISLFDTRMSGTSTEMVTHRIQMKPPATRSR